MLRRSIDGPVCTLTIDREERRNALSWEVVEALRAGVAAARADPSVRVLVLTGAGERAFCAGADLQGMSEPASDPRTPSEPASDPRTPSEPASDPRTPSEPASDVTGTTPRPGGMGATVLHDARGELAALFEDLWSLGKPTVARVRGYALAGGFGLAMACDLVVAADDAVFGTPELDVGLWPFMITVPLTRSMPPKVALELMLTGRRVGAEEARRIGFVNRVVPPAELDAAVAELAATLAAKPPEAVRLGRDSFYAVWGRPAEDALRQLHPLLSVVASGREAAEGIAAFVEKRPPPWRARPD